MAYDGSNIWVANQSMGTVWRVNPGSGVATNYPTGQFPGAVAFDGRNVWVTNAGSNTLSKIIP